MFIVRKMQPVRAHRNWNRLMWITFEKKTFSPHIKYREKEKCVKWLISTFDWSWPIVYFSISVQNLVIIPSMGHFQSVTLFLFGLAFHFAPKFIALGSIHWHIGIDIGIVIVISINIECSSIYARLWAKCNAVIRYWITSILWFTFTKGSVCDERW